jgi:hypothetical protein
MPAICSRVSLTARICHRFVCLESEVDLGALFILCGCESIFYCVLVRATVYKKNICIEMGTYNDLLRSAPTVVLEFVAWIIGRSQRRRLSARLANTIRCEVSDESVHSKRPVLSLREYGREI